VGVGLAMNRFLVAQITDVAHILVLHYTTSYHSLSIMIITLFFWLLALAIAITVHEAAHAWMADRLGDPTPRLMGRLSLNPIRHYDPIGTTLLLITALFGPVAFGWAKPVPFDPYNFKNPKKDAALVSLAGPMANILVSVFLVLLVQLLGGYYFLARIILLNFSLAIFNLVPIYPLDGEKIIVGILPHKDALEFENFMHRYGNLLLLGLILPVINGQSLMGLTISPIINFLFSFLTSFV
jgi:Zn-dependent protease